jgi:glycerate 2-kinase
MKIIIAPNAFKDCMSSYDAALSIEKGVLQAFPHAETIKIPVADGGDGLLESLYIPLGGKKRVKTVVSPTFKKVNSEYCYFPIQNFALIEMAKASGLALLSQPERNACTTTSFGTGELVKDALLNGTNHILLGIGGSATNDAGIGILSALGFIFLDINGNELAPIGQNLIKIIKIDSTNKLPSLSEANIELVCDVDNPLYGHKGAAYVYAPQKGASLKEVENLDSGLKHFAKIVQKETGKDISKIPGGGAAGGIGAGLYGLLNAKLRPGIDIVLEIVEYEKKILGADLVITAEGQIDHQTAFGKAPAGVAKLAKKQNIPCIAIAGSIGKNISNLHDIGINSIFSLCPGPINLEKAITNGKEYLSNISEQIVRCHFVCK